MNIISQPAENAEEQSQDSGDGVSTQDWITNEKLGIDENNNSY